MDRGKLRGMLKKAGIKEKLEEKIMETYKKTKNMVQVKERKSEEF